MNVNFVALLILLLPGFWSLWVFQRVAPQKFDEQKDWPQVIMGLSFGLLNLAIFLWLSRVFDLYAIEVIGVKEVSSWGALTTEPKFWKDYGILGLVSLFSGGLASILNKLHCWPTYVVANLMARIGRTTAETNYQSSLDFLSDTRFTQASILRISYPDGRRIAGMAEAVTASQGEIELSETHLFDPELFPYGFSCWAYANIKFGVLLEFVTADPEEQVTYRNDLARKWENSR